MQNNKNLAALKPTSLVLTGNLRLARYLQAQYGQIQIAAGHEAWPQPGIMDWSSWLRQSWQEVEQLGNQKLLTDNQARLIWEQVISANLDQLPLLNLHASARSAQQAWKLLHDFNCPLENLDQYMDEDTNVFLQWAQAYDDKCSKENWLDEARLGEHLYNSIAADQLILPGEASEIWLAGFDDPTPLQQNIFKQLETKGVSVTKLEQPQKTSKQTRLNLPTTRDEIKAAAQWTRQKVLENSRASIAIVIPQLASVRADVVRILDQVLCPESNLPGNQDQNRPYDISLGLPLGQYPLVFNGLLMLESLFHRMALEKVGRLLVSSFLGGAETESHTRALLDASLREQGETSIRIDILMRLAKGLNKDGEAESHACPLLAEKLTALLELKEKIPTRQSCHVWVQIFTNTLNALGWPGERDLSNVEYQTIERWYKILESFAAMESLCGLITLHEALNQLRNMANETIFQPSSEARPIIVMDVFEEKVLSFDYLWVMGLHDDNWPRAPRPHPLLPTRLQQELAMPHASAEKELEFAQALTSALLTSASEVVVSAPQREGDKDLRPSPLIKEILESPKGKVVKSETKDYAQTLYKYGELESLKFDQAPPVFADAKGRGGTGVIKLQSQCPFSAFARYRLDAKPLADYQAGLTSMERGSLVHRVLELIWGEIETQEILLTFSDDALTKLIVQIVTRAIDEQVGHRPETFTPKFIEIETARLTRLIMQWLEIEKNRPPFKVIAPEEQQFVTIAGMTLKLIIDRIDALVIDGRENGEYLLIDYKTGSNNNLNNWFDDRPREPQLPMYSYLASEQGNTPTALAFAQLAVGDQKFIGLGNRDGIADGIKDIAKDDKRGADDWLKQINDWKNVLENLAQQYVNGEASVNPKDDNICNYCPYPELCRIHELNQRLGHLMDGEHD